MPPNYLDTIYALSSGAPPAGVAIIRLSGPGVRFAFKTLAGSVPQPRRAALRELRDPQSAAPIDRGLVLYFPAPASFTGEDCGELHLHGGRAVIEAVLAALGRLEGFRLAEPGEFSRRAFEAGKMDLTALEGLADLIAAETEAQRRQALRQQSGALAALYDGWRADLIAARARIEAMLDFSDEDDVPTDLAPAVWRRVGELVEAITAHLNDARRGERLRAGLTVALAGPPNSGKSSLLNLLSRREVAIVTDRAGTTRDLLDVALDLDGYPVTLTDMAGLRETADIVEAEGIRRARARIEDADLALWITDATAPERPRDWPDAAAPILVLNKIDLLDAPPALSWGEGALAISAKTGAGIDGLLAVISARAEALAGLGEEPVLTRARHRQALERSLEHLSEAVAAKDQSIELRAEALRLASFELGRITGRVDVEDILDQVFSTFCIGK